jgi:tetratricopeptide (TPR) repeat protein
MQKNYLLLIFFVIILLSGCIPKGDPKEAIDAYNQKVLDCDFASAYELLSGEDQDEVTKEEYIQLQNLNNEITKCISLEAKKVKEYSNQFGYKMVTEYEVTETWYSYSEEKEYTSTYLRYVVNDGGKWKVYNEGNYKNSLATAYIELGWMYLEGKGKPQNLSEAKKNLEKGLGIAPTNGYGHYLLGKLYNQTQEYDMAIFHAQKALEFATEEDIKEKANDELEKAYQGKGNQQ